jgi:hypothetical protein
MGKKERRAGKSFALFFLASGYNQYLHKNYELVSGVLGKKY